MIHKLFFIFIISLALFSSLSAWGDESKQKHLAIAYSIKTLTDVDIKDATAAMKSYVAELGKSIGVHAESALYENLDTLIRDVEQGKIDLFALRTIDYLRVQARLNGEVAIVHMKNGKPTSRYLLLVPTESGFLHLRDLKNKKIVIQKGDDIIPLFLNTTLLREGYPEMQGFFSSIEEKTKPSQVVLSVFFGQADACVAEDSAFKTIIELNPQVGKKLKVLKESPELAGSISFFRRGLPDEMKAMILQKSTHFKDYSRGKQILMLFKVDNIARAKESDMDSLKSLMAEYERLRKKGTPRLAQGG